MKVLIFVSSYSLKKSFLGGFRKLGNDAEVIDLNDYFSPKEQKKYALMSLLPKRYFRKHLYKLLGKINERYQAVIAEKEPDLVLVYNDQMMTKETAELITKKGKLCFYLGDNPFFLTNRDYYFDTLPFASHIFTPDTYWGKQLEISGFANSSFLLPGYDEDVYFPYEPDAEELQKYKSDLFFLGTPYKDIWGRKRASFLNHFADFDLKLYGPPSWRKQFGRFPKLESKTVILDKPVSFELQNTIANCNKLSPVDANPAVINGVPIRIIDSAASGCLPLAEYRKDILSVFGDVAPPIIESYTKIPGLVNYFLKHDNERIERVTKLREFIKKNFSARQAAEKIIEKCGL
jgi:hypothetical protein